jgi:hypothetical protein
MGILINHPRWIHQLLASCCRTWRHSEQLGLRFHPYLCKKVLPLAAHGVKTPYLMVSCHSEQPRQGWVCAQLRTHHSVHHRYLFPVPDSIVEWARILLLVEVFAAVVPSRLHPAGPV